CGEYIALNCTGSDVLMSGARLSQSGNFRYDKNEACWALDFKAHTSSHCQPATKRNGNVARPRPTGSSGCVHKILRGRVPRGWNRPPDCGRLVDGPRRGNPGDSARPGYRLGSVSREIRD